MNENKTKAVEDARRTFWLSFFCLLLFCLCLCSACSDEYSGQDVEGAVVNFSLSGISSEVGAATRGENLVNGQKVRVLAYLKENSNKCVAEKDYTVQSDGSLVATDGNELRLAAGTYDLYAFTPDLVANTDGIAPVLSVEHGVDFASSLTANQTVAKWSSEEGSSVVRTIKLNELNRKCSQLAFQLNVSGAIVSNERVKKVAITEATFTNMATAPLTATGADDLPMAATNNTNFTIGESFFFTDEVKPTLSSGSGVALPKSVGNFGLKLRARFNDVNTLSFETATIANMAFAKGYRYGFIALWQESRFLLSLVVAPWTSAGINTDLGGNGTRVYILGEWTVNSINTATGNGINLSVSGWTPSASWTGDLGSGGVSMDPSLGWTVTSPWTSDVGVGAIIGNSLDWTLGDISTAMGGE